MVRRGLEKDGSSPQAYFILGVAQLRLNRLDEAESSAREALLRNPKFAEAFLLLSDVGGRRHEYRTQLQGLDTYLKLEPHGSENERVRRARELVLGLVARTRPEE
jgi:cytochrome c-type biogenesis protein CcmH/NrfG